MASGSLYVRPASASASPPSGQRGNGRSLPADVWQLRGRFDQLVTVFPALGIMVVRLGTRGGDARSAEDGQRWERDVGLQLLGAVLDATPALTRPRPDATIRRVRPYDRPERLGDAFAPWFPPPLPPPGPPRARAVGLQQETQRISRRRLFAARVHCPPRALRPCEGELSLDGARGPKPFAVAPGTSAVVRLRLVRRPQRATDATLRALATDPAGGTRTALPLVLRP